MFMEEIRRLKNVCHQYLETYIKSTLRVSGDKKHYKKQKRKAYQKLAQELKIDTCKCHFSNMNTVEELERALVVLQGW